MRELKFRCMDEDGDWHYATLDQLCGGIGYDYGPAFDVIGFTEGKHKTQFTGLTDKNGADIYYGDIINSCGKKYRIEWIDSFMQPCVFTLEQWEWYQNGSNHFKYCYQEDNEQIYFLCSLESYEVEVVGNIYQSPELLNES